MIDKVSYKMFTDEKRYFELQLTVNNTYCMDKKYIGQGISREHQGLMNYRLLCKPQFKIFRLFC